MCAIIVSHLKRLPTMHQKVEHFPKVECKSKLNFWSVNYQSISRSKHGLVSNASLDFAEQIISGLQNPMMHGLVSNASLDFADQI